MKIMLDAISLAPERDHGINSSGTSRGHKARRSRDGSQQQRNGQKSHRIRRPHAIKQACDQPGQEKSGRNPDDYSDQDGTHSLSDHLAKDVTTPGTEC